MTAIAAPLTDAVATPSFDEVYASHVGFVWRVLRACGVPAEQLEDAAQDVFVVVHRRLRDFEGRASITTWLFAITRKVATRHRRKPAAPQLPPSEQVAGPDAFDHVARSEAAATIAAALDQLDEDKRIVFALVELEQVSVADVARMLDINQNTAHSRLRLARAEFAAAVRRRSQR